MNIFPAIDRYAKKAVRLYKGDYAQMTVYSDDPLAVARDFEACGARFVHLVDLEGARDGATPNIDVVERIVRGAGLFTEIGGGVRDMKTVETYLGIGVCRVILGTAAVEDRAFLKAALARYGERIAVGADVRDGFVSVRGWTESAGITLDAFLSEMEALGVKNVICTDISKDGAMRGANIELYARLCEKYALDITASGGVSTIEDVQKLRRLGLYGAIIGKAYYTGAIDLKTAVEVAK